MARPLRIEHPGAVYHVFSRGNGKNEIFLDAPDHERFLEELEGVVDAFSWVCYAYCLMPNHYHLMVKTPEANLSQGMQYLNGTYSQAFNCRHDRVGHVMQGRFKSPLLTREIQLFRVLRYIVLNPVFSNEVKEPGHWRWSSYRATAGICPTPPFLDTSSVLELFSEDVELAQAAYIKWVEDGIGEREAEPDGRTPLSHLFNTGDEMESSARAMRAAYLEESYSKSQIARHLGISCSTVSRLIKSVSDD